MERWETSGRPQTEIAGELEIMPTMLRRSQRKLQDSSAPPMGLAAKPPVSMMTLPADKASEIARLRRELGQARMERCHGEPAGAAPGGTLIGATPSMSRTGNCYDKARWKDCSTSLRTNSSIKADGRYGPRRGRRCSGISRATITGTG